MPRRLLPAAIACAVALLAPSDAHAKDLRNRIGAGYNAWFGQVNALSVRYGLPTGDPAVNIQVEGNLGLDADNSSSDDFFAGGRLLYGVVVEDNMNLSLGAGAGYIASGGRGRLRLQPSATVDFFLFGLENLGFSSGVGLNLDLGSPTGVSTTGAVLGGLHYWF